MIELIENIFAVEVPDNASGFDIELKHCDLMYYEGKPSFESIRSKSLTPGSYSILFTTKDCTEAQATTTVERMMDFEGFNGFKSYMTDEAVYRTAMSSLKSLLRSKSLNPENNYLLIRKLK